MKKTFGKVLETLSSPFVKILDFIAQKNIFEFGLFAAGVITAGFGIPALLGAISTASLAPFIAVAAGFAIIPGVFAIAGHLAEKVQAFGKDLQDKSNDKYKKQDAEFIATVKKELEHGNESYKQYNGLSKKEIKQSLQQERDAKVRATSVDEVGY